MAEFGELRVHGVSGTPPRDILYTDPARLDEVAGGSKYTDVWANRPLDPRDTKFETHAFRWAGLTSGNWVTAFWILLAPFAFANVAGWMSARDTRLGRLGVRGAGLALTGLFTTQATTALVLIPYVWMEEIGSPSPAIRYTGAALGWLVGAGFIFIVWRFSAQSHFTEYGPARKLGLLFSIDPGRMLVKDDQQVDDRTDPAGSKVTDPILWQRPAILHRLRRLHLGVGLALIGLMLSLFAGSAWTWVLPAAVLGLLILVLMAMSIRGDLGVWITSLAPHLGVAGWLAGVAEVAVGTGQVATQAMHQVVLGTALVLLALGIVSSRCGLLTVGALTIGTLFGGVLGIAAGLVVEGTLGVIMSLDDPLLVLQENGAGWVAVAMLVMVEVLLLTALVLTEGADDKDSFNRLLGFGRAIVRRGHWLMRVAGVYGLLAGGFAAFFVLQDWDGTLEGLPEAAHPSNLPNPDESSIALWVVVGLGVAIVAALIGRLSAYLGARVKTVAAWVILGGAAVGYGLVVLIDQLGITPDDGPGLTGFAISAMILIPGGAMFNSILRGVQQGDRSRRKIGILWDLGSFWPRWFHPLAPPAYGPIAVSELTKELRTHRRDVLGAHSQGSLIAAVALSQMSCSDHPKAFLTYGSQLGQLYPNMFPASGISELVEAIAVSSRYECAGEGIEADKQEPRYPVWYNLWRNDDPIGGHYVRELGDWPTEPKPGCNVQEREGSGHSGHEDTGTYRSVRERALGDLLGSP